MLQRASTRKLEDLLALPASGHEQDWDVELADASRLGDFLDAYETAPLSPDDKVALMALILASTDRYLGETHHAPEQWARISVLLAEHRALHWETTDYWAREGVDDPESWFSLTPLVRAVVQR